MQFLSFVGFSSMEVERKVDGERAIIRDIFVMPSISPAILLGTETIAMLMEINSELTI